MPQPIRCVRVVPFPRRIRVKGLRGKRALAIGFALWKMYQRQQRRYPQLRNEKCLFSNSGKTILARLDNDEWIIETTQWSKDRPANCFLMLAAKKFLEQDPAMDIHEALQEASYGYKYAAEAADDQLHRWEVMTA